MALTAKQRLFVAEYVRTRNGTAAAKAAGYGKGTGKKADKVASVLASRLLDKVCVREAIEEKLSRLSRKAELKAEDVLNEIRRLAFVNLTKAYNEDGTLKKLHEMPRDVQASLSSVETDEIYAGPRGLKVKVGETKKIKLNDKVRALEMLAKHFKLLTDMVEMTGKDGGPQVILTMPADGSEVAIAEITETEFTESTKE